MKENLEVQVNDLKETLKKTNSKILENYDEYDGTFITPSPHRQQRISTSMSSISSTSAPAAPYIQLKELINVNSYTHLDCAKMLERVGLDLNELECELVRQNRILINSRTKTNLMEEKFRTLVNLKQTIAKLSLHFCSLYDDKCIKQSEIDVWENSYARLKEIYMCKVNSDTVEKIYYNIEIAAFRRNNKIENDFASSHSVFSSFSDSKKTG